jgi:hypothetical protein
MPPTRKKSKGPYLIPLQAGERLIELTLERIFNVKPGVRVKWTCQVWYQDAQGESIAAATFASGNEEPEQTEVENG